MVLPKLCFVCDDDACLAPMAAAAYNHLAADRGLSWWAVSAALRPRHTIKDKAVAALEFRGISPTPNYDYRSHIPCMLTGSVISGCEAVVCLDPSRLDEIRTRFPMSLSKLTVLSNPVAAPAEESDDEYNRCLSELIAVIRKDYGL